MFLNGQKKYRGYVTLKHYVLTLKMPIYQKVLMLKIFIVMFITVIFQSIL